MDDRARLRVLRNFVASILMSNLSKSAIAEIAEELAYGRLGRDLSVMLKDVLMLLPDVPTVERYVGRVVEPTPYAEMAHEIVQRKKITKKGLIQAIGSIAPRLLKDDLPNGTVREVLDWFFETATTQQGSKLLALLSGAEQDQYLKGISRRS